MNSLPCRPASPARGQTRAVSSRTIFPRQGCGLTLEELLWLQTWLDGEALACEFTRRGSALKYDASRRGLVRELRRVKSALAQNEVPRRVPQSRACYWRKIARAIRASQARSLTLAV